MEALWNVHVGTGMPPGLIHDQGDLLLRAGTDGTCKLRQCQIHRLDVNSGQDQPLSAPRLGMHEAVVYTFGPSAPPEFSYLVSLFLTGNSARECVAAVLASYGDDAPPVLVL